MNKLEQDLQQGLVATQLISLAEEMRKKYETLDVQDVPDLKRAYKCHQLELRLLIKYQEEK